MSARDDLVSFSEHTAHSLHNTVTAISMAVELALEELEDLSPQDRESLSALLDRAQRSVDRLAAQVQELPAKATTWPLVDETRVD